MTSARAHVIWSACRHGPAHTCAARVASSSSSSSSSTLPAPLLPVSSLRPRTLHDPKRKATAFGLVVLLVVLSLPPPFLTWQDKKEKTAIFYAAEYGMHELVVYLVSKVST